MTRPTRSQLDLFDAPLLQIELPPSQRIKALALLQALLMEALPGTNAVQAVEEQEGIDNDKDHA